MSMDQGEPPGDGRTSRSSPPKVGVLEIFLVFMAMGLSGFGGVLPFVRRTLVERRSWLTPNEFTEVLGLSQLLPGPNVVNISAMASDRPMSPTRLMTKAFLAAAAAECLCCQKPMRRYDARPTPSQPRNRPR